MENIVPWSALQSWVSQQQAQPSALTKEQLLAVSYLVPFVQEPEFVDADYVSELMHFSQARRKESPAFRDLEPVDVPVCGSFAKKWRTTCTVAWIDETFPKEGFSYATKQTPPIFSSKKKAKQYAAMEALRFLKASKPAPPNDSILSPPPPPPPQLTAATPAMVTSPPVQLTPPRSIIPGIPSPQSSPSRMSLSSSDCCHFDDDEDYYQNLSGKINGLCRRLGYGTPSYVIVEKQDRLGFFDGYALFHGDFVHEITREETAVSGVLGKKATKSEIATRLLRCLVAKDMMQERKVAELFAK